MKRFVVTYANPSGTRYLVGAAQARNTFATREEAEESMNGMFGPGNPNNPNTLRQLFGDEPNFAVLEVECWETGDPKRMIW